AGGILAVENGSKNIVRLHPDGSIDSSFQTGIGFNDWVFSMALQDDGKVLIGGSFSQYNGLSHNSIIRLNANGSVDSTFESGIGFEKAFIYKIALQDDGKIVIGGYFTTYNNYPHNNIIRLNQDGTIDSTFQTGSGFNQDVNVIAIQSNGKMLVGGNFSQYNGQSVPSLVRLHGDGSLDVDSIERSNIKLFPNPSIDQVIIENIPDYSRVTIYDGLGNLVYSQLSNGLMKVDTNGFSEGIYLVRIVSGKKEEVIKLVVSR